MKVRLKNIEWDGRGEDFFVPLPYLARNTNYFKTGSRGVRQIAVISLIFANIPGAKFLGLTYVDTLGYHITAFTNSTQNIHHPGPLTGGV